MSKSIAGSTTKFLYDGLNPAQELDASNSSNANLLTGGRLDEYLQRSDSVGARSFLSDNVDSTLVLTDENGFLQTQYTYVPILQEQYYLTFLPLLAIFSARFMIAVATVVSGKYSARDRSGLRYMIAIAFLGGTIALLMTRHDWIWAHPDLRWLKESVVLLLVAGTVLMLRAQSAAALTVLLCAVCICPYYLARVQFLEVNTNELQSLRYAIEKTSPTDTMMDGFSGIGVFRPHAYFYWYLDPEIIGMMTDEQKRQLLADLQTGKLAPRYLIMDSFLDDVLSPIRSYVSSNFSMVQHQPYAALLRRD
jgi:hypothetical protein